MSKAEARDFKFYTMTEEALASLQDSRTTLCQKWLKNQQDIGQVNPCDNLLDYLIEAPEYDMAQPQKVTNFIACVGDAPVYAVHEAAPDKNTMNFRFIDANSSKATTTPDMGLCVKEGMSTLADFGKSVGVTNLQVHPEWKLEREFEAPASSGTIGKPARPKGALHTAFQEAGFGHGNKLTNNPRGVYIKRLG